MKLLLRKVLQVHSPQCELLHSEYTLVQRLEPQFPTSQGKCPSDLTTETASPPPRLGYYWITRSRTLPAGRGGAEANSAAQRSGNSVGMWEIYVQLPTYLI